MNIAKEIAVSHYTYNLSTAEDYDKMIAGRVEPLPIEGNEACMCQGDIVALKQLIESKCNADDLDRALRADIEATIAEHYEDKEVDLERLLDNIYSDMTTRLLELKEGLVHN